MKLSLLGTFLRRSWWLLVVGTVIGIAVGSGVWLSPKHYAASATVMMSMGDETTSGSGFRAVGYLLSRVTEYAAIAQSEGVLRTAVESHGLDISPEELGRRLTITSPKDTGLIVVGVKADDPQTAVRQANALADTLTEVLVVREKQLPIRAKVVDRAIESAAVGDPRSPAGVVAYGFVGAVVGGGVAMVRWTRAAAGRTTPREVAAS